MLKSEEQRQTNNHAVRSTATAPEATRVRVDRRSALLEAALDLFSEKPYEDISVDDICARAGVAHGLLSYYFGGKRGLFAAAVRAAWADLVAYEGPREDERTAAQVVRGYLSRHFEYARRYPERFAIMMRTGHADEQVMEILSSARSDALKEVALSIGCREEVPARLKAALHGWSGYVDSVTLDYLGDDGLGLDLNDITDMCVQVLIASVRSARDWHFDTATELDALDQVMNQGDKQGSAMGER